MGVYRTFFVSLLITAYSFYNYAVYGSCEPGEPCYITALGVSIGVVEKSLVYVVGVILIATILCLVLRRLKR